MDPRDFALPKHIFATHYVECEVIRGVIRLEWCPERCPSTEPDDRCPRRAEDPGWWHEGSQGHHESTGHQESKGYQESKVSASITFEDAVTHSDTRTCQAAPPTPSPSPRRDDDDDDDRGDGAQQDMDKDMDVFDLFGLG